MTPYMAAVVRALTGIRFPLEHEKQTQQRIWSTLQSAQSNGTIAGHAVFRREVTIAGGVIDFLIGDCGVEIKIKGQPAAICRQLKAYAAEPTLSGLVLVTSKPVAVPQCLAGKPVAVFDLARAWL